MAFEWLELSNKRNYLKFPKYNVDVCIYMYISVQSLLSSFYVPYWTKNYPVAELFCFNGWKSSGRDSKCQALVSTTQYDFEGVKLLPAWFAVAKSVKILLFKS
jgi:hypothetical protein